LGMEVGRLGSLEVFSTFPREFSVSNSNLVPGDLASVSIKAPKGQLDQTFGRGTSASIDIFKKHLKTYLFKQAF